MKWSVNAARQNLVAERQRTFVHADQRDPAEDAHRPQRHDERVHAQPDHDRPVDQSADRADDQRHADADRERSQGLASSGRCCSAAAAASADKPITLPTEMSIPPEMITTDMPTAITAIHDIVVKTLGIRLLGRRKPFSPRTGAAIEVSTRPMNRITITSPSSCMRGRRKGLRRRTGDRAEVAQFDLPLLLSHGHEFNRCAPSRITAAAAAAGLALAAPAAVENGVPWIGTLKSMIP